MNYSNINHDARIAAKLDMPDYCILDLIYRLEDRKGVRYKTWCWLTQAEIGRKFGISEKTVSNRLHKLQKRGWIEFKNENTTFLKRTTAKYEQEIVNYNPKDLPIKSETSSDCNPKDLPIEPETVSDSNPKDLPIKSERPSDNNKSSQTNSNKDKDKKAVSVPPTFEQRQQERYLDTFKANYQALDVPKSFNEKTRDLLKKFLWLSFQSRPSEFAKLTRQQMTVKQFYTILVREQRSYAFLEALCINAVNNNWKNLNSEWMKDFKEPFVYVRPVN